VEQQKAAYKVDEKFEVLNEGDTILVLVDEAHRTQAGDLHANLQAGLPNCARIGFTGTPIIMGEKKRTHEIFGEFIDRYTIKEAEADGATVPVLYEGRTANGAVKDGANLDELFEDLFRQHSPEDLEAIKKKYATKGHIFDAPALITDKAHDIIRHYGRTFCRTDTRRRWWLIVGWRRYVISPHCALHETSCWPRRRHCRRQTRRSMTRRCASALRSYRRWCRHGAIERRWLGLNSPPSSPAATTMTRRGSRGLTARRRSS
jgi:hypothetical protein